MVFDMKSMVCIYSKKIIINNEGLPLLSKTSLISPNVLHLLWQDAQIQSKKVELRKKNHTKL